MEDTHGGWQGVTGLRQTQKAVAKGLAARVYLACDGAAAAPVPLGGHPRGAEAHHVPSGTGLPHQGGLRRRCGAEASLMRSIRNKIPLFRGKYREQSPETIL